MIVHQKEKTEEEEQHQQQQKKKKKLHWEYPSFCVITGLYIPILSGAVLIFTGLRIRLTLHRRRNGQTRVCENISRSPISVNRRQPALGQPSQRSTSLKYWSTNLTQRSTTRGSRRTLKILTFTSVAYFTFWSPYVVIVLAQSFVSSFQPPSAVEFAVMWLANTNSAVNVFIYSSTNTQFRRQCVRLASRLCCSRLSCTTVDQTQVLCVKLSAFFVNADAFQYADASCTLVTRWSVVSDHHGRKTSVYIVMLFQIVLSVLHWTSDSWSSLTLS